MKRLLLLTVIFLTACGPSQKEKEELASVTCAIMGETRNMDSALRVAKVNEARKELGEAPFLDGDQLIKQSIEFGICPQLVLNDPKYKLLISTRIENIERARAKKEQAAKRQRDLVRNNIRNAFETQTGKVLLDCTKENKGSLLFDLKSKRVMRTKFGTKITSLDKPIEISKYTKFNIQKGRAGSIQVGRIEKTRSFEWVGSYGNQTQKETWIDENVSDKIELFSAGIKYTKLGPNGGYVDGYLRIPCEGKWKS